MSKSGAPPVLTVPRKDKPEPLVGAGSLLAVLPQWTSLARLWFEGEERWKARGYSALVLALSISTTAFSVRVSYAERDLSTALSGKDAAGFYRAVGVFVVLIVIAAPFFALFNYVEERLILAWRAYLTRRLIAAYFTNRAYFLIQQGEGDRSEIDNPDQRIGADVAQFVRSSTTIIVTLVTKVFNCIAFAGVLWNVNVPSLVVFLFAYALVGTFMTTNVFGRPLMVLTWRALAREGDLRFGLIRVRENAEAIAFYRGEGEERRELQSRFSAVLSTMRERIGWNALFDLWTNTYNYATVLVPSVLVAPRYFSGQVEFGVISQAVFAFRRIEAALSIVINNLDRLSGLAAETERLDTLMAAMRATGDTKAPTPRQLPSALITRTYHAPPPRPPPSLSTKEVAGGGSVGACPVVLQLEGLSVFIPGTNGGASSLGAGSSGAGTLVQDLELVVRQGESLMVTGPSGCGKSSLLRAIAGLWVQGAGQVRTPPDRDVFYLPQLPYMPLGSLRQQLVFPTALAADPDVAVSPAPAAKSTPASRRKSSGDATELQALMEAGGTGSPSTPSSPSHHSGAGASVSPSPADASDATLAALLDQVALPDLLAKSGGLDAEGDWGHVLSCGEQQRVAWLRLLLHRPALAFLDESTSALDAATEARLYALMRDGSGVASYVSVGHRMQLLKYHSHVLECQGGGKWVKHTAADFQRHLEVSGLL